MKFNPIRAFVLFCLITGFAVFQNCGRAAFKQVGSSSSSLVPLDIENPSVVDNPEVPGNPETPGNPGTPGNPQTPGNPGTPDNPEVPENPENPEQPPVHSQDLVACIVKHHGKSMKLGVQTDNFVADTSVKKSACMSEKACLEYVPQKFTVEGAYDRGYCGRNPHVVILSDAEVLSLLAKP